MQRASLEVQPEAGDGEHRRRPRILLVDQDIGSTAALRLALEPDCRVGRASTAAEALRRVTSFSPDLLVLHLGQGNLDGASLVRTLRACRPAVPVVVIAEPDGSGPRDDLWRLGIEGFFEEPLRVDEILDWIASLLSLRGDWHVPRRRFSPRVRRAIEYLGEHYARCLTVGSVAQAVGISASHLAHRFSAETGLTVRAYLTRVRIEAATQLLRHTDENLASIAKAIGFCDAPHLSRVFREQVGCGPGNYRRQRGR